MSLKIGQKAPAFTLPGQEGAEHSLAQYRGQWVLIYFYPKDDTAGCTKQACAIRDDFPEFGRLKAVVLGISADTVASHKKFAEKYTLPYTLLADTDKKVIEAYGVWAKKKFMGREYMGIVRSSFLIDPDGTVVKMYEKVKPADHAAEVLEDLRVLQNK